MNTERIDIVVSENGSRVVKKNFDDIASSATSMVDGVLQVQKTLDVLSSKSTAAGEKISGLKNKIKETSKEIASYRAAAEAGSADAAFGVVKKTADLELLKKQLSSAKKEIDSFNSVSNTLKNSLNVTDVGASTKINDLGKSVEKLAKECTTTSVKVKDLKENVKDLGDVSKKAAASSQEIEGGFGLVSKGGSSLLGVLGSVKGALGALGIVFAIGEVVNLGREIIKLSDTYTNFQNRIKLVTSNSVQLANVTEKLFQSANNSRSSYEEIATLFTRVSFAVKDLGVSQKDVFALTETVTKALRLSGSTAAESSGAIVQFAQALSSGTLRGEELNSVLEQAPPIADLLAKAFGVTIGELKKLGEAGKLTTKDVVAAVVSGKTSIDQSFAKTTPSIAEASQVLANATLKLVGNLDEITGASKKASQAILTVANSTNSLANAFKQSTDAQRLAKDMSSLNEQIFGLNSIIKNSIGELERFGATSLKADEKETALDALRVAMEGNSKQAKQSLDSLNALGEANPNFKPFIARLQSVIEALIKVKAVAESVKGSLSAAINLENALAAGFKNYKQTEPLEELGQRIRDEKEVSKLLTEKLNESKLAPTVRQDKKAAADLIKDFKDKKGLDLKEKDALAAAKQIRENEDAAKEAENALNKSGGGGGGGGGGASTTFSELLSNLQKEGELLKLNTREREIQKEVFAAQDQLQRTLTETEKEALTNQVALNFALRDQAAAYETIKSPLEEYGRGQAALNALLAQGRISAEEYSLAMQNVNIKYLDTQTDFGSGFKRTMLQLNQTASDGASQIGKLLTNAFKGAEDAFVKFVQTGKFDFKSFANSIIADLARIAFQQAIVKPLTSLLGFGGGAGGVPLPITASAKGNVFSGGNVIPFAKGGVVSSPTLFPMNNGVGLMGEAGKEAIVPLTRGSNGELGIKSYGGGGGKNNGKVVNNFQPQVSVTVNNGSGGEQEDPEQGNKLGKAIADKIQVEMVNFVMKEKRNGGLLYGT